MQVTFAQKLTVRNKAIENIREMSQKRLIQALRELDSNLPNTGECLHLAHNWLVCGKDTDKARKASYLFQNYRNLHKRLYDLEQAFYLKNYQQYLVYWKSQA